MTKVETIRNWEPPNTFKEIQVFLDFANFYRRFIYKYSSIAAPLTNLLKGGENGRLRPGFEITPKAKMAFEQLQKAFYTTPLLVHFDPTRRIKIETDASGYAAAAILSQEVLIAAGAAPAQ